MTTTENKIKTLAPQALELFKLYVMDAGNWGGSPLVGGNVCLLGEKEDRGLITHLKRAGLIATIKDEDLAFILFTEEGKALAVALGLAEWIACATPAYKPQEFVN